MSILPVNVLFVGSDSLQTGWLQPWYSVFLPGSNHRSHLCQTTTDTNLGTQHLHLLHCKNMTLFAKFFLRFHCNESTYAHEFVNIFDAF